MDRVRWAGALIAVWLLTGASAGAQVNALRGVRNVAVRVASLEEALTAADDSARVQQVVELALRRSGISVVQPSESSGIIVIIIRGMQTLTAGRTPVGFAYSVMFDFDDRVTVAHGVGRVYATTYSLGPILGVVGTDYGALGATLAEVTSRMGDTFANDYLKANPRP